MNTRKKLILAAVAFSLQVGEVAVASGLEEIVVTARQRSESLQDVPLSETAFTARQIEDAKIDRVGDFIALAPNITLAESQSAGISFMTIRGIAQVRNGEPPVATVVDGVLQINSRQFTQELFDIEQIEILRGPQGAIYGRNATGGAILINTKQPTNETEGYIRLGLGTGGESRIQGSVGGAIVKDKLMYKVAGSYIDRDGYFDNNFLDTEADPYEDTTIRGLLKWSPSENFLADLRVNISRTNVGAANFQYQPSLFDPDEPCFTTPALIFAGSSDADAVTRDFCANNRGVGEREIDEVFLKLDYDFEFATLTSISSWNRVEEYVGADQFPYTAAVNVIAFGTPYDNGQTQYADVEAWSEEIRLTSNGAGKFRWAIGAYYLQTDRYISTSTSTDTRKGVVRIERTPTTNVDNPTLSFVADENDNTAWALFGNVNYDITSNLEVALAARYDQDDRKQKVSPLNTAGAPGATNTADFSKLQPKVSLSYRINDDVQVYSSYGIGFRSGQFNQNGFSEAAAAAGTVGVRDVIDQEETATFELGFKSEFAGNRVRLNGSAYSTMVDGFHYFVFIGAISGQVLVNIEEVEIFGGEIELLANLAEGLDVYLGYGITKSEILKYSVTPADKGNKAPYVPDATFNIGAQYRFSITENVNGLARIDYEYRGAQFWDPENSTERSALNLVHARIGIESANQTWSLTASVNNLTDEKYNSEWVGGGFSHPAKPRIVAVDLRYNF